MKKVILSLVFILASGMSFMNATSTNDETLPTTKEVIKVVEEFGKASDCNWGARQLALEISEDQSDRGVGGELMENYNKFYAICMK